MFSVKFNKYLKERKCSARKFSALTKISEPTISRYKTGKTVPSLESGNIEIIADALSDLSGGTADREEIYEDLLASTYEDLEIVDYKVFSEKLSALIEKLNINQSKLADAISISPSHLYKICHGQIKTRNPIYIAESVSRYVAYNYKKGDCFSRIQNLIWGDEADKFVFSSAEECFRQLKKWLLKGNDVKNVLMENLLHRYSEYDVTNYLPYPKYVQDFITNEDSYHSDSQVFMGLKGLKEAFFSWVNIACSSKINDEIFMFDEVLSALARQDYKIAYDYIAVIEKLVQNGRQVTFINNLYNDLYLAAKKMLVWLPLTMSRRVSNYYINESYDNLYKNMLLISSDAVLIGHVIDNDYDNGYYTLIRSAPDILNARRKAASILRRAECSNHVYDSRKDFEYDLAKNLCELKKDEPVNIYLSVPPLATMTEDLLKRILKRNNISSDMTTHIMERYYKERNVRNLLVQNQILNISLNLIDYSKWQNKPVYVSFNDRKTNLMLTYDYSEYKEHIELTKDYVEQHNNINLCMECLNFYENMNIILIPGKYGAVTTLRDLPVDACSNKKIIVDSFIELLYVITPSNYPEVVKNDKEKDLLDFYKNIMQRNN